MRSRPNSRRPSRASATRRKERVSGPNGGSALEFPALAIARAAVAGSVLVGRPARATGLDRFRPVALGDLLMSAGRPVLVMPENWDELNVRDVVVGWKDAPEARRALSDALPFLKRAEQVNVIEIGGDGTSLREAKAFLDRHEVHARSETIAPAGAAGDQLIRFARQAQSHLIVVGAYGHSRLREWVLGGVTRELLTTVQFRACSAIEHAGRRDEPTHFLPLASLRNASSNAGPTNSILCSRFFPAGPVTSSIW